VPDRRPRPAPRRAGRTDARAHGRWRAGAVAAAAGRIGRVLLSSRAGAAGSARGPGTRAAAATFGRRSVLRRREDGKTSGANRG